jgi:hypothetical protein
MARKKSDGTGATSVLSRFHTLDPAKPLVTMRAICWTDWDRCFVSTYPVDAILCPQCSENNTDIELADAGITLLNCRKCATEFQVEVEYLEYPRQIGFLADKDTYEFLKDLEPFARSEILNEAFRIWKGRTRANALEQRVERIEKKLALESTAEILQSNSGSDRS